MEVIHTKISPQCFQTWFVPMKPLSYDEGLLTLQVPNQFVADWVEEHYQEIILDVARELCDGDVNLAFVVNSSEEPEELEPQEPLEITPEKETTSDYPFNARYTFETFVVGNNNRFAAAAAMAVAEKPAKAYNPLFIYGGVGLGKTHLMQAVGHAVRRNSPESRVRYVSSETFMNEMILAIQQGSTLSFRDKYRRVDVLLIDDVQFLRGKESTQEEFFHTFNALYEAHRQIVLTSDRPPKKIQGLEERLVSRFEWGLVTDIQAPDFETRIAILRKKAEIDKLSIPDEVINLIATSVTSNIRELEGSLVRLLAFSSLTGSQITTDLAKEVLRDFLGDGQKQPSVGKIQQVVAHLFGVPPDSLKQKRRTSQIALARQVAMYIAREITDLSLERIGEAFGGRDHTTVLHAHRKIAQACGNGDPMSEKIELAVRKLRV